MALYNKTVQVVITMADFVNMNNCFEAVSDIVKMMDKEEADCLENTETGEIIERDEMLTILKLLTDLTDSRKSNVWEMV